MPYNQLTNLDYFNIKNDLITYLRANSDFTDYDYLGSVLNQLLDVLAYNTYYTSFNINMVANELFLDSATLRDNVVAIAKQLGYNPKSATAPVATVNCTLNLSNSTATSITFKAGSGFLTVFENNLYQYLLLNDVKATPSNGTVTFSNLNIYEGILNASYYTVSSTPFKITLNNAGIDISTIVVNVYESNTSTTYTTYTPMTNILTLNSSSTVYFIDETDNENYNITFGDGILGKALSVGNYIKISYLITNGDKTNSTNTFAYNGILTDQNGNNVSVGNTSVFTINPSYNGSAIETISSIKKNAPGMYGAQNRAVTADDYIAIIRTLYSSIADVYAYGGEKANPPQYGKVFIVIKPSNANSLTSYTKNLLQTQLKSYSVASIVPQIVDASILYIELTSKIFYNQNLTTKNSDSIRTGVIQNVENYIKTSNIEKFGGKFRFSKFSSTIDSSEPSISSNLTTIALRKDFYPSLNNSTYYELCYYNEFFYDPLIPTIYSSGFTVQQYPNYTCYMQDNNGIVFLYRIDATTGNKITVNSNIGTVNYTTGEIRIYNLTIIKGTFSDNRIQLRANPKINDIQAVREMFLQVDIPNSTFTVVQD